MHKRSIYFQDILLDAENRGIPENSANFIVGSLVSVDDDKQDTHIYQVITHWELFTTLGNKLIATSKLDYERKATYNVIIQSTDNGVPRQSFKKQFNLTVIDENEMPSNITVSPLQVR